MTLREFLKSIGVFNQFDVDGSNRWDIKFVGLKWQDEHHPSATLWPIELSGVNRGNGTITVKFITTRP